MIRPQAVATPQKFIVRTALFAFLALGCFCIGCGKPASERAVGPKTFPSPDAAAESLHDVLKADDVQGVLDLFGPEAEEFLISGDVAKDKAAFDSFKAAYEQMHRWGKLQGDARVLVVGIENYPFPFPLRKNAAGRWYFDAEGGRQEFLARRIGDNELTVIGVLNEMVGAQAEYFSKHRDGSKVRHYARRFASTEGKHDGLYWTPAPGEPESPLGPLAARAAAEGHTRESLAPFHGYFFRILTEQGPHADGGARSYVANGRMTGGFAFLAYPAEYRKTGVMSFLVNQDGAILQKDLGAQTVEVAKSMASFDPDPTWLPAE